jgi:hypothetical protein
LKKLNSPPLSHLAPARFCSSLLYLISFRLSKLQICSSVSTDQFYSSFSSILLYRPFNSISPAPSLQRVFLSSPSLQRVSLQPLLCTCPFSTARLSLQPLLCTVVVFARSTGTAARSFYVQLVLQGPPRTKTTGMYKFDFFFFFSFRG